jgi:hypothetical protein
MADPTDRLGKGHTGQVIHIVHVATRATCHFKAFLTSWEDNFKQDWNSYETVGRMDPIKTYKRTSRTINFAFDIPSYNAADAANNLLQVQTLIQMSYPTFNVSTSTGQPITQPTPANSEANQQKQTAQESKILDQQTSNLSNAVSHMVSPPLLRIKFANWINDPTDDPEMSSNDAMSPDKTHEEGETISKEHPLNQGTGLYGTIENVKFVPDLGEAGGFYGPINLGETAQLNRPEKILIPKLLKLELVFNVLHTNDLGYFASNKNARSTSYPYNANRIKNRIITR